MARDLTALIVVLSVVFAFLLAGALFMMLRFTPRYGRKTSTTPMRQRSSTPIPLTPGSRVDRWSARGHSSPSAVGGIHVPDPESAGAENDLVEHNDRTAGEFGATVRPDGTRSFLNGWFALDSTIRSTPARGAHAPVNPGEGDEWEVKSAESDNSDPEAYRPKYATI